MEYKHIEIERKWQQFWSKNETFRCTVDHSKPKYYVLDMFPYPSGAGLHVGHPLGYIASDIYTRYKRHQGFNVLHPMGYDAFGLPAEQYAIQTGTHPAVTTEKNIARYREQLDRIGFSFDWSREVRTSDPKYYKWTQWTFIQLFKHWYNRETGKAESIESLIRHFKKGGSAGIDASCTSEMNFTESDWASWNEKQQQEALMNYRLAYLADTWVNWCPALGTVLANDEVVNGVSERGGHPVERKLMKQWSLRITAYAQRLLDGLEKIDWFESLKEMQRYWIGRSEGATVFFSIKGFDEMLEVFTTRPDTLWGATFMVLAPEHELVSKITPKERKEAVQKYVDWAKNRSERDRMAEVKQITGEFTGAYGINPVNGEEIPIWIADYVLAGYGTGAIMAVPAHDSRDFAFAKHFGIPVIQVVAGKGEEPSDPAGWTESYDAKEGRMVNSGFITGQEVKEAITSTINYLEKENIGFGKVNFKLRDAIFSRQRYWGEPFPVYYKDGMPYTLDESELPLELPEVDKYLPTETGEPPLARAKNWTTKDGHPLETNTMPGFAGSSGYYLRYMDPWNNEAYFSKEANEYWKDIDLYLGGDEHATGHLIYSRFWNMFLFDLGLVCKEEPFRKLINQGKIQGRSNLVYRLNPEKYAEYLLWNELKEGKPGIPFSKGYKDGHRSFDFYSKEANLILEIRGQHKLERLRHYYEDYAREKKHKILLIPTADIIEEMPKVLEEIRRAIALDEPHSMLEPLENRNLKPIFVSKGIRDKDLFTTPLHVDVNIVDSDVLDLDAFRDWRPEFAEAEFMLEDGKYICGWEIEKMSKSKHNVVNPDDLIERYGADTFRMYEMFLGPLETHKPWDTKGIEGVYRFTKKLWRLFFDQDGNYIVTGEAPDEKELRIIHKSIKKIRDDIERFSFNTAVSQYMICVNELSDVQCHKKEILEKLVVLISPYAPHMAEELWERLGNKPGISYVKLPEYDEAYLQENTYEYPVSFNGKMRFKINLPLDMKPSEVEKEVLSDEKTPRYTEGKTVRKVIVVPGKIINIVVS